MEKINNLKYLLILILFLIFPLKIYAADTLTCIYAGGTVISRYDYLKMVVSDTDRYFYGCNNCDKGTCDCSDCATISLIFDTEGFNYKYENGYKKCPDASLFSYKIEDYLGNASGSSVDFDETDSSHPAASQICSTPENGISYDSTEPIDPNDPTNPNPIGTSKLCRDPKYNAVCFYKNFTNGETGDIDSGKGALMLAIDKDDKIFLEMGAFDTDTNMAKFTQAFDDDRMCKTDTDINCRHLFDITKDDFIDKDGKYGCPRYVSFDIDENTPNTISVKSCVSSKDCKPLSVYLPKCSSPSTINVGEFLTPEGDPIDCSDFDIDDIKAGKTVNFIKGIFRLIMIFAPILLIIFGSLDFAKATLASDEQALKKSGTDFGKRAIATVLLIILPLIINLLIGVAAEAGVFGNVAPQICIDEGN